jgi:hypothetical protein
VIVLFFVKIWLVDTLKETQPFRASSSRAGEQPAGNKAASFEKKYITIRWKDAGDHVGEYVTTAGKIVAACGLRHSLREHIVNIQRNFLDLGIIRKKSKGNCMICGAISRHYSTNRVDIHVDDSNHETIILVYYSLIFGFEFIMSNRL